MCTPTLQNNPQSWLCMFQNCTYFVMFTLQVTLHSALIPTAKTIKYLGVKIQWNSHIEYITTNKASNILRLFTRTMALRAKACKLVCPVLEYPSCLWDQLPKTLSSVGFFETRTRNPNPEQNMDPRNSHIA